MRHASRLRALAVAGLCLSLVSMLYLMLTWPEESVAGASRHLREIAVPSDDASELEAILMNLDYISGVQVHLLRIVLTALLINTVIFILVLVVSLRIKHAPESKARNA